jgi:hypothetical protein
MQSEAMLLFKSMETIATKIDLIVDKVNHIDKRIVSVEEWRKFNEETHNYTKEEIRELKDADKIQSKRIARLENFKWYLFGMGAIIPVFVTILLSYLSKR